MSRFTTESKLKVCEHLNDVHIIPLIRDKCKCSDKEFDTINSIKSHHPACKKKQTNKAHINIASNTTNLTPILSKSNTSNNVI